MLLPLSRGGVGCTGMEPPDPRGGGLLSWSCGGPSRGEWGPGGARGPSHGGVLLSELRGDLHVGNGSSWSCEGSHAAGMGSWRPPLGEVLHHENRSSQSCRRSLPYGMGSRGWEGSLTRRCSLPEAQRGPSRGQTLFSETREGLQVGNGLPELGGPPRGAPLLRSPESSAMGTALPAPHAERPPPLPALCSAAQPWAAQSRLYGGGLSCAPPPPPSGGLTAEQRTAPGSSVPPSANLTVRISATTKRGKKKKKRKKRKPKNQKEKEKRRWILLQAPAAPIHPSVGSRSGGRSRAALHPPPAAPLCSPGLNADTPLNISPSLSTACRTPGCSSPPRWRRRPLGWRTAWAPTAPRGPPAGSP